MDKELVNKIIKAIMDFLGKNVPKEVAKPVQPIIVVQNEQKEPTQPTMVVEPLTKENLLEGRDKQYPSEYTAEVSQNLDNLLVILNKIQTAYGKKFTVNSGWRPAAVNAGIPGAAVASNHMKGLAADIADADGEVMRWTIENLDLMKSLGVHMEDWRWTPTWTHYQIVPPKSGNRIYIPSTKPAIEPNRWAGKYLGKYN